MAVKGGIKKMIFTLLGYVLDVYGGEEKIINDNGTVSIEISDGNIIRKYVSPLCEYEIDCDNILLNFGENPNGRCELSSISFGNWTYDVSNKILDEVTELNIDELYHTMCERIML